jgi:hypothetical protein
MKTILTFLRNLGMILRTIFLLCDREFLKAVEEEQKVEQWWENNWKYYK